MPLPASDGRVSSTVLPWRAITPTAASAFSAAAAGSATIATATLSTATA